MSTAAANKKQKNQPALATTGRGAALYIALGIAALTLGCAWLLSLYMGAGSQVLTQLSLALQGLCGPLCPILPMFLIWGGVKLLVATRHRVSARSYWILFALYLLILSGYTLTAQVAGGQSYLEYVGAQNTRLMLSNPEGFTAYLNQAFMQRTSGAGGLLGMLIAYPLWRLITRIGGVLLTVICALALLFILFRVNPGDLFRSASDYQERRRLKRAQRAQEATAQDQQQAYGPVVQEAPMPAPAEPAQAAPASYYDPAPVYDARAAYAPAAPQPAAQDSQGFYPVQPDLYDERFPLHDDPPAVQTPIQQPAAEKQAPQARPSVLDRIWKSRENQEKAEKTEKNEKNEKNEKQPEQREETPRAQRPAPVVQRPAAPAPQPIKEEDDLPWDEPEKEAPQRAPLKPAEARSDPARAPGKIRPPRRPRKAPRPPPAPIPKLPSAGRPR